MANRGPQVVRKSYLAAVGTAEETAKRSAFPGWEVLRFEFLSPRKDANDNPIVVGTRDVQASTLPDEIQWCSLGHGISQKLGDDLAGIAAKAAKEEEPVSEDPEDGWAPYAMERFDYALENLIAGVWVSESEGSGGGASVTILLEAIVAAFADKGRELTEEEVSKLRLAVKDEDYRKKARERADVKAHMATIAAKRAEERRKKLAKEAKTATLSDIAEDLLA